MKHPLAHISESTWRNKLLIYVVLDKAIFLVIPLVGVVVWLLLLSLCLTSLQTQDYIFIISIMLVMMVVAYSKFDSQRVDFLRKTVPLYMKENTIKLKGREFSISWYDIARDSYHVVEFGERVKFSGWELPRVSGWELSREEVTRQLVKTYCRDYYPFKKLFSSLLARTYHYLKHL